MTLPDVLFYILAVLTGVSAVAVVITQNIVRAATWLLFALAGTSGVFFLLGADFVGATQLLVYVGGTLVLVVFGVMLTAQSPFINMKIGAAEWAISLGVGLLLYGVLAVALAAVEAPPSSLTIQPVEPVTKAVAAITSPASATTTPATAAQVALAVTNATEPERTPTSMLGSKYLGAALLGDPRVTPDATLTGAPSLAKRERAKMNYLLPFEIVSVHLLVVLIGAAYLARAKRRRGAVSA